MESSNSSPADLTTLSETAEDGSFPSPKYEKSILRGTTSKSLEDKEIIKKAVEQNSYFSCLDVDQIESFVDNCTLVEYDKGEAIITEGDWGENFYIVSGGTCDVVEKVDGVEKQLDAKKVGSTFGAGGFLFNRRRSATIKARTKVFCWVMSRSRFWQHCLHSDKLLKEFQKYASVTLPNGAHVMTTHDFIRACFSGHSQDIPDSENKVGQLLNMYKALTGQHHETITFKEYVLFQVLMARPDPEYDVAHFLMDTEKKGYITRVNLQNFIEKYWLPKETKFRFNTECDFVKRYFGESGRERLRGDQLSVFLTSLKNEVAQQAFQDADNRKTGYITLEDLIRLLRDFSPAGLPSKLEARIKEVYGDSDKFFNFADYMSFASLLLHLPSYATAIRLGCEGKGSGVSKDDFKVAVKNLLGVHLSTLEADLFFQIFDEKKINKLDIHSVRHILGRKVAEDLKPIRGRHGLYTFAPPPGYVYYDEDPVADALTLENDGESPASQQVEEVSLGSQFSRTMSRFGIGWVAGMTGITAVYPFDVVKTRLQNDVLSGRYLGIRDCFQQLIQKDGFIGLYRGLLPVVLGAAPEKSIKLAVNDMLRSAFTKKSPIGHHELNFPMEILAGCGAGLSQAFFSTPYEALKVNLQIQGERVALVQASGKPTPPAISIWSLAQKLGLPGMYRAFPATCLRDIPFSGIYFPAYAYLKRSLCPYQEPKASDLLIAGALAGIPAAYLTTPFDMIKTTMQVEPSSGDRKYYTVTQCASDILKKEGVAGLFKGATMRVVRQSPQFAVTLLTYEYLHKLVSKKIDPDMQPRPPTNAPVKQDDFESAFHKGYMSKRVEQIQRLLDIENKRSY